MKVEPDRTLPSIPGTLSPARAAAEQRSFSDLLAIDRRRAGAPEADEARKAAEALVAMTLVEPFLRQARESRDSEPPFGQTDAERQFGSLMDARTAERMVKSWDLPLVERLARQMREHTRTVETSRHEAADPH